MILLMYEETLLQLSKDLRFRSSEVLDEPISERRNPACGDEVAFAGKIGALKFYAQGCAVCVASCTALCQELEGCSSEKAKERIEEAMAFFASEEEWKGTWGHETLPALGAVRKRPMRMTCVRLAWEAVRDVL